MELDERKQSILESIIRDYVATAEPVGSRAIARNHSLSVSAATVRNEMSDLEQMGYLEQPHTSAGRIPSQQGLRYYVDFMMKSEQLSDEEMERLNQVLRSKMRDLEEAVHSIGQCIADMTNYVSFVVIPAIHLERIANIQVYPLQEGLALLVVLTDLGGLLYEKMAVSVQITPRDLQAASAAFRRILSGTHLHAIRRTDLHVLREQFHKHQQLLEQILQALENMQDNDQEEKVLINGVLNILNEPEFKNIEKLRYLLALFEGKETVKQLLPEEAQNAVDIRIGRENTVEGSREFSLVFSGFKASEQYGKIGLLGPVRMEYWKAAGTVESVRSLLDDIFGF
jgi:heat-inducible transcriptional repressor